MDLLDNPYGLAAFLEHLNIISLSVIFILLIMSILSWYLIITKAIQLGITHWRSNKVLTLFWSDADLITHTAIKKAKEPFSRLALQSINASFHYKEQAEKQSTTLCTHSEFLMRHLRRALNEERAQLDSGLTILATVGSTAPFIGLFGTVLGIYDALVTISAKGSAALNTVAAPVGEALIMTALGLAVAIPAVLAYNALVRGNRAFLNKLEGFAHDLHTYLSTGARMESRVYLMKPQIKKNDKDVMRT
ncbi:hypothetical protein PN36_33430 [Candidatus Thiomargarita nelsonii]|uniref:Biopolymer transport protein ExbB n=1 Tax=Candidatus Thiomargarita nelsonii TaxID=1003181 RepID=A0A4E0QJE5_9GAMM|nr:hypothetical protein PN36_33430 [Candidatus Thiomargarita nelsonii]